MVIDNFLCFLSPDRTFPYLRRPNLSLHQRQDEYLLSLQNVSNPQRSIVQIPQNLFQYLQHLSTNNFLRNTGQYV